MNNADATQPGFDNKSRADQSPIALPGRSWGLMELLRSQLRLIRGLREYKASKAAMANGLEEFEGLFRRFLAASVGRRCLRLLSDKSTEPSLGSNWAAIELNAVERRSQETGSIALDWEDRSFDVVLCTGLNCVSQPAKLITEISRVLDENGQVWVQVPLSAPYFPEADGTPQEYWRITPNGLRVMFSQFDEILTSVFSPGGNALRSSSFYYGIKGNAASRASAAGSPRSQDDPTAA